MAALPSDAHVGEVSLTVSDLDRSMAFYTSVLGFEARDVDASRAALAAR